MNNFRRLVVMFLAASIVIGCLPGLINFREFVLNQNVFAYEGENQDELLTLEDLYGSSKEANPYDNYEKFVIRLYNVTLEREADESGLNYWSSQLRNHEITGITVAYNFVMSEEFQNKPYSEDEYISLMYNAFFGRDAADSEIAYWADLMRSGVSRDVIFENFGNSDEFYRTCTVYGIIAGTYRSDADNWQTSKVNLFVDGLYNVSLGRLSDKGGMTYWTNALINGEQTGAVAAYGFVFSVEYYNKNKDDDSFVKDLYLAFLGREADEGGLNYWKNEISIGRTDLDIFNSFVLSDEFSSICNSYSIVRGGAYNGDRLSARSGRIITPTPTPIPTPVPGTPTPTPKPTIVRAYATLTYNYTEQTENGVVDGTDTITDIEVHLSGANWVVSAAGGERYEAVNAERHPGWVWKSDGIIDKNSVHDILWSDGVVTQSRIR